MPKVLVTGAGGGLGSALAEVLAGCRRTGADLAPGWPGPVDVVALGHAGLDVADAGAVRARVAAERPAVIVNCAAYTDVDGCERNRARAFLVNGDGPGHLAAAAAEAGACLVQIGTDYVFDGLIGRPYREEDAPNPQGVYGASKLAGEATARARATDLLLVRASRVFGPRGKNFLRTILDRARQQPRLELVTDLRGSPTCAADLAWAIVHLLRQRRRGIFHFTNSGSCSFFEWAQEALAAAGLARELVPVTADRFAAPARRPKDATLDCSKFDGTNFARRTWQDATREVVRALMREDRAASHTSDSSSQGG